MTFGDPPPVPRPVTGMALGLQGWECPRCHGAYAPWVAECVRCRPAATSQSSPMATGANQPAPLMFEDGGQIDACVA